MTQKKRPEGALYNAINKNDGEGAIFFLFYSSRFQEARRLRRERPSGRDRRWATLTTKKMPNKIKKSRRRSTLPHSHPCSTIDAKELNFRVRDGIGCGLFAIITGKI